MDSSWRFLNLVISLLSQQLSKYIASSQNSSLINYYFKFNYLSSFRSFNVLFAGFYTQNSDFHFILEFFRLLQFSIALSSKSVEHIVFLSNRIKLKSTLNYFPEKSLVLLITLYIENLAAGKLKGHSSLFLPHSFNFLLEAQSCLVESRPIVPVSQRRFFFQ